MMLKPGAEAIAEAIFRKWDLDFAVIGRTTEAGRLVVKHQGRTEADIPLHALAHAAPEYKRAYKLPPCPAVIEARDVPAPNSLTDALEKMLGSPQLCSRRWVWEQYDHMVMADTVQRPGGDAAIVRVHGTQKGLAATCDVTPRYCAADPREGAKQAVAEAWRNLCAVGADPLAITDCMNFGNPERPEIMGQFAAAIEGMGEACRALDFPVVSGNVSLYNETNGQAIPPTPAVGGIGLLPDVSAKATVALERPGEPLVLLGAERGHLGRSLYMEIVLGRAEGAPPPVDLAAERQAGDLVRALIREGAVSAVHDLSDGGLLIALAEMALAGGIGATLLPCEGDTPLHALMFGEDQGRYLLAARGAAIVQSIIDRAQTAGVPARIIGQSGGQSLVLPDGTEIALDRLADLHEGWLPHYMGAM
jgi:phosphoribosylformylglycinamidine synthase